MASMGEEGSDPIVFRGISRDEAGMKKVERTEVSTHNPDTLRYIDKKMKDKGIQRMDRHPVDGLGLNKNPKSGHGGKYTWEGPGDVAENEMGDVPAAIDEGDPNYVDEEMEERIVRGEVGDVAGLVVGEVEVAKEAKEGVARVEVRSTSTSPAVGLI